MSASLITIAVPGSENLIDVEEAGNGLVCFGIEERHFIVRVAVLMNQRLSRRPQSPETEQCVFLVGSIFACISFNWFASLLPTLD